MNWINCDKGLPEYKKTECLIRYCNGLDNYGEVYAHIIAVWNGEVFITNSGGSYDTKVIDSWLEIKDY